MTRQVRAVFSLRNYCRHMNHRRQRFLCFIQEATTEKTSSRLIVDCCALRSARRIVHRVRSQVHTVSHNAGCASNAAVSAARVARSRAAQRTKCFQFRHVLIIHFENFPGIMCLESNFTETFFKSRRLIYRHFTRESSTNSFVLNERPNVPAAR